MSEESYPRIHHGIRKGENHPLAKLKEIQVRDILSSGDTQASLARKYEVSEATISLIKSGARWKHV